MRRLRGHHLVCLHFFDGEGYDEPFIRNLLEVVRAVREGGVAVAEGPDDVCAPCRHRRDEQCTQSPTADREIREMDRKALALLGLTEGEGTAWASLREKVREIFPDWNTAYCFACSWRSVCEKSDFFRELTGGK